MALRIRKDGRIFCAALNEAQEGDIYIDDNLHHILCTERILVTTECDFHMANGGEWWWRNQVPEEIEIDEFYN